MPPVGSKIKINGLAHVGSTSENQADPPSGGKAKGGEANTKRNMTLHFHQMDMSTGAQPGVSDADQEAESAKGAKAEMDKALKRGAGGDGKDSEGEESSNARTPRGGQD